MKQLITTLTLLLTGFTGNHLFAQSNFTISGKISAPAGGGVAYTTISLLNAADSSLLKTAISDADGKFELLADSGKNYLLHFSMIGFTEKYSAPFLAEKNVTENVTLEHSGKSLDVVTVTAKKPMIEIKADKTIFNVEGSINAQGSNALELLQKSPGVRVDNDENISMKGKNGVKIYIDGKMTQLDAKDLAAYLKGISSSDVEAVEMIYNPGAKYDASGNAGIINIRLKKNKKIGTNGSVNAGYIQGISPKVNGSVNLNYRNKKVNVFGSAGTFIGRWNNSQDIFRIQNDSSYDQRNKSISRNRNYNVKIGADFFINKNHTLGVMTTINTGKNNWSNNSNTDIAYEPSKSFEKNLQASNAIAGNRTNINNNINYRYTDTAGLEINVDADYGLYRGRAKSKQPNFYKDAAGNDLYNLINSNNTPTNINIYTLKADVEMPKWKGKFGFGAKTAYVVTDNLFEFFTDENNVPVKNLSRSNSFKYTENVNAAYVNYSRMLGKKWSMQSGLRLEQTNSEGELKRADGQTQSDEHIKKHYLDLFPSVAVTYNVNEKNTFNLTYSRRIDRPSYRDLNPFENKLDELTYEKGNAFLKPQYGNNFELSHVFKGMFTTTLGYNKVKDFSSQYLDTTNSNATFVQQRNLASQQLFSIAISSSLPIKKWWNGYVSIYGNYQKLKGQLDKLHIDMSVTGYGGYLQNTFTLNKNYTVEVSGWLNGPSIDGSLKGKPFGAADVGIQRTLLNKNATIKISVTDVFHTARWKGDSQIPGFYTNFYSKWESQTVRLNFTYRFGNKNINNSRERKTGLESESGRIK